MGCGCNKKSNPKDLVNRVQNKNSSKTPPKKTSSNLPLVSAAKSAPVTNQPVKVKK